MGAAETVSDLRLLANPTRARIVSLIMESPNGRQLVGRLATELELRQPTVSHHVKALFDRGILERRPEGRLVWYSVATRHVDRVLAVLQGEPELEVSDAVLARISTDLAPRFAGTFAPETVERFVRESHALLADRPGSARNLASLTSRFAIDRLDALKDASVPSEPRAPDVLFVCVHNAGRSQLAAGILRHLAGDKVSVRTAGSAPADAVRSVIVTALDEIGVPIGAEFPKPLTDEVVRAADVVVTMGCGDACPIYPGRRYLDWDIPDPVGLPLPLVRDIRDDIERRVRELLATVLVNGS